MSERDPTRISPTAHYTGYVWYRNGMSHPCLKTGLGRLFYASLGPSMQASRLVNGGLTVETFLLQRHKIIDHVLRREIDAGRVGQIVEVAAGLSPRGIRFARDYAARGLVYVEADLADMAADKRARLDGAGLLGPRHHVVATDLMRDSGPECLAEAVGSHLRPDVGTAVVTEGLIMYFDRAMVETMWERLARFLEPYPHGVYVSDLHVAAELPRRINVRMFIQGLRVFAGGAEVQYRDAEEAIRALGLVGFPEVTLHSPADHADELDIPRTRHPDVVRVVEARVRPVEDPA